MTTIKTPQFATATAKSGGDTLPLGKNGPSASLQAQTGATKLPKAVTDVYVSQEDWQTFVDNHGGYAAAGRKLRDVINKADTVANAARVAMVLVGARLVSASPAEYRFKSSGAVNGKKIADALGVGNTRDYCQTLKVGITAVLDAGIPLYGPVSPELMALALTNREREQANKKRGAERAKKLAAEREAKNDSDESKAEDTTAPVSTVAKMGQLLTEVYSLSQTVTAEDRLSDEFPQLGALVDAIRDNFGADL